MGDVTRRLLKHTSKEHFTLRNLPRAIKMLALLLGAIVAVGCSTVHATSATDTSEPSVTVVPEQTRQPTTVPFSSGLAFATPLIRTLNQSGIHVLSVRDSTFASMFPSTHEAAWIETDKGIVDVLFFATPEEASHISITESPNSPAGRFSYIIQAPSPTLQHDQTIDAAFPLYFTVGHGMLMVTSSQQLNEELKHLFSER